MSLLFIRKDIFYACSYTNSLVLFFNYLFTHADLPPGQIIIYRTLMTLIEQIITDKKKKISV